MHNVSVIKRDGTLLKFEGKKIVEAICKAMERTARGVDLSLAENISQDIEKEITKKEKIDIEEIQEMVIKHLLKTDRSEDVAKEYIEYRSIRNLKRRERSNLDQKVLGLLRMNDEDTLNENANKDSNIIPTQRDLLAGILAKDYALEYMLPKRVAEAHINGDIHQHDLDYAPFFPMSNCMLIDLKGMLENGFKLGNADIQTPQSISVACSVTAQIIAQVASHIYGGNTINEIDKILAPYVEKSFMKHFKTAMYWFEDANNKRDHVLQSLIYPNSPSLRLRFIKEHDYAIEMTKKEIDGAFQALEYEVNSLSTSNGQTAFCSFGFGRGTSWAEREIQIAILNNRIKGLGKDRTTAVFPKLIFALEEGINLNPSDPNYDIKQLALKCSTLRMYPDILSVPKVIEVTGSFKNPMGCRSFLAPFEDEQGSLLHDGRGNLGVTTLNLPRVAIEAKGSEEQFYKILDQKLQICKEALMYRIERLQGVKAKVAPVLYMEGACGVRLQAEDTVDQLFKNGRFSISLGYIGIHETILSLYGEKVSILEDKGIEIVTYLKKVADQWKEETGYGFSVYSTPAESLAYRFCKMDREKFGVIENITDKDYYMNSFHLNVKDKVSPLRKIDFESSYPEYVSGGFISYCEFDSLVKNPQALEAIWDYAYTKTPYFGTNTPVDHCYVCDYQGEFKAEVNGFTCPNCNNHDPESYAVTRRTCGYLANPGKRPFNKGKQQEMSERVKHQ